MVEAVENLALRLAGTNGRGLRERSFTLMDLRLRLEEGMVIHWTR